MSDEKYRPIRGLLAIETKICLERLAKAEPGETVLYEELNNLAKCDVRKRRNVISTSTSKLLTEQGKVFIAERGKGVRLLRNEEIPNLGARDTSRIGRIARRCAKKLAAANFDALSPEAKVRHNASMTVMALFQRGSTAKAVKLIEETVRKQANPLPLTETLKLFGDIT